MHTSSIQNGLFEKQLQILTSGIRIVETSVVHTLRVLHTLYCFIRQTVKSLFSFSAGLCAGGEQGCWGKKNNVQIFSQH